MDLSTLISTVVGGTITIAATILSFWLTNRSERKKRESEEIKKGAANALSGYFKIFQYCNLLVNIGLHIDKSYENSRNTGLETSEPFSTVGPPATKLIEPNTLESYEYSFLMNKGDHKLLEDLHKLQQYAINMHYLFNKYSEEHVSFQEWMNSTPGIERKLYGPVAHEKIPEEERYKYEIRAAQLNQLIGFIIEHIKDDLEFAEITAQSFADKAHNKYPSDFPKLEIEHSHLS